MTKIMRSLAKTSAVYAEVTLAGAAILGIVINCLTPIMWIFMC